MRRTHLLLELPEGMLNRSFSDSHHLRRFVQPTPDVLLQLICIDESPSVDMADFDIEVRFGSGNWSDGVSYPLLDEVILPDASPEFLRQHSINKVEGLCNVPLLQLATHRTDQGFYWVSGEEPL